MIYFARASFLLFSLLFAILIMPQKVFSKPPCSDGETADYITKIDGKGKITGWGAEVSARYKPVEWTQKIQFTQDGLIWSRSEKHIGGGKEVTVAAIRGESQVRVLSWMSTLFSPAGKQESRLDVDFTDPSLKFPEDMYPGLLFPFLLRGADLESIGVVHEARIWWGPKSVSKASWVVTGKEKITVPAGSFECYVIEETVLIDGKGFVSYALQRLMPNFYLYLTVEPPHYMVKFKQSNPGGDIQTDMLIRFTP